MKGQKRSLEGLEEWSRGVFKGTQNTRVHGRAEEGRGEARRPAADRPPACLAPESEPTRGSGVRGPQFPTTEAKRGFLFPFTLLPKSAPPSSGLFLPQGRKD